ncbi:hypothetical protein CONLIGDRAFT_687500 [Coniochaeta ligniaria NRRL 30616]|uniref:C2H2-type domain-containing protein n=1 Tax=Coniochaeta ligniaria NRRL 30616 TaxID=1408157 RepID=A0A1J7IN03_9PEZI|nr:hypothetical protein CONLIGDRAFT_687500 [Coniochaeta ligniaria NRRL 30616]
MSAVSSMEPLTFRFGTMDNLEGRPGLEAVYPRCQSPEPLLHRPTPVNIARSVSPTADPTPCALRENPVEDCSHAKLVNWIWRSRATAFHLEDRQRNECPMPLCRQVFNDFDGMITHLHGCAEVAKGLYWCWDCHRAEEFPLSHCRSCKYTWTQSNSILGNTMKKVKRVLSNSSNSLKKSLKGKRTRKDTNVSPVSPTTPVSELFGRDAPVPDPASPTTPISELSGREAPVPELQSSVPPYDSHFHTQSSQPQPLVSPNPWANFVSVQAVDSVARQSPLTTYPAELPAATSGFLGLTCIASLVNAADRSSPLTNGALCESPTTMEDASNLMDFVSWTQPKSSSWSSTVTYISQGSRDFTVPQSHLSELEGSVMPDFGNDLRGLESNSFLGESIPQSIETQASEEYVPPAKQFTLEHAHANGSNDFRLSLSYDDCSTSRATEHSRTTHTPTLHEIRFQGIDSIQGGTSSLDSDAFFQRSLPLVHNVSDQLYRTSHDISGYNLEIMRQYNMERPQPVPESTQARQNSWSSSSSTTLDYNERQNLPLHIPKQMIAELPATTLSHPDARQPPGTITRHRARTIRKRTEKKRCPDPNCPYTAEGPSRSKLLKRHMKTHEDMEDWFECGFSSLDGSVCRKNYNRRDNLREHQKREQHRHGGREKMLLRKRLPGGPKYKPEIH